MSGNKISISFFEVLERRTLSLADGVLKTRIKILSEFLSSQCRYKDPLFTINDLLKESVQTHSRLPISGLSDGKDVECLSYLKKVKTQFVGASAYDALCRVEKLIRDNVKESFSSDPVVRTFQEIYTFGFDSQVITSLAGSDRSILKEIVNFYASVAEEASAVEFSDAMILYSGLLS